MKKNKNGFLNRQFFLQKNRRGIITEYLPWLLIALAVLAIVIILIFTLKGQGVSLIDKIKDILR